jgi:hypothetical protein
MQALVYTDIKTLIYREEKNPKLVNKEIHNGSCAAPKIILLI